MSKRVIYFDYIRVFATIAVIVLHVASQNWNSVDCRSFEWNIFNIYDGIVRWGVPAFLMISGTLFLGREIEIKKLYSKNILRMFTAYIVWSTIYAIVTFVGNYFVDNATSMTFKTILFNIIKGGIHMWFIPMIIGLYMCVPIIKEIVAKKNIMVYFLIISFVFTFVIPQLVNMSKDFIGGIFFEYINQIHNFILNMNLRLVIGYSFYFVLGYFWEQVKLTRRQRRFVYILGGIGFIITILLNALVTWKTNVPCDTYYDNFTINVMLEAIAVYTWFKYREYDNEMINHIIQKLSKYSFGVYLVHFMIINVLYKLGIDTLKFNPILSVAIISILVIVISYLISSVMHKIPYVNKWIV